ITSPLSAPTNENYEKVLEYWRGGNRPSVSEAKDGLFKMAEDLQIENTTRRPDVIAALFSPSFGTINEPYKELTIPGNIKAVDYDIGTNNVSYWD
ncbi:MAG TPA: glycoside hydrolase family 5, partial [Balneolaceae bacterium]|nr:glycoside hydrolase family 5 [Balneolaceae bacterium]